MKIAYITSSAYSGSTLLTFILNSHPQIGTISEFDIMSEIKNNSDYRCSCGDKIRKCKFFKKLKIKLNNAGMNFELDEMDLMFNLFENESINRYCTQKLPLIHSNTMESVREKILQLAPSYKQFLQNMHSRNSLFMQAVLELQSSSVFLDANKNPYRIKRLSEKHDVLPIYLFKNGIAGAYSFYTKEKYKKSYLGFKQACNTWFLEQITINRVIQNEQPVKFISLSYGDMCNSTQETANKIFELCGLQSHDISNFHDEEHHIIGNSMRISNVNKIVEREDWKDNLTQKDIDHYKQAYDRFMPKLLSYNQQLEKKIWYP